MNEFELLDPVDADGNLDGDLRARQKQASRDRDAADLKSGKASAEEIRRRNDMWEGIDFSKVRISAIGDQPYLRHGKSD